MIAEVARFPKLGQELYEKGKKPYLDRLDTYLRAEIAVGTLVMADVELGVRQFLGMINDILFWPHMLVVGIVESEDDISRVVDGAVETLITVWGRSSD